MLLELRRGRSETLALAAQAALVVFGHAAGSRGAMLIALSVLAGVSFLAWIGARRRARAIDDTATSKVASAAQGYVELLGRAEQLDGAPTVSPYTGLPCVWYRYRIECKESNNKWTEVESRQSEQRFRLVDGTGACIVDPQGAEVLTSRTQTWIRNGHRYTEQLLLAKDRLYAIGEFTTGAGATLEIHSRADVAALLADWKQDRPELLARFDANRDGEIDFAEWEAARTEARVQVAARHREALLRDGPHLMRRPRDGRLYLLSNLQPVALARRSARMAWVHLILLLGAAAAIGWTASHT